jgi:hypothetical protein
MTKEEHLEYLGSLKEGLSDKGFGSAIPKCQGAFYFGHYITYSEYVDQYEKQCIKEGWI